MKKISSKLTFIYKSVFPLCAVAFLVLLTAFLTIVWFQEEARLLLAALWAAWILACTGTLLYVLWWAQFKDLVDEVLDLGDELLVKNGYIEERVPLSNIMHIEYVLFASPQRATLRLVEVGSFGNRIPFVPAHKFSLNPRRSNPVVEDLIVRVDQARRSES